MAKAFRFFRRPLTPPSLWCHQRLQLAGCLRHDAVSMPFDGEFIFAGLEQLTRGECEWHTGVSGGAPTPRIDAHVHDRLSVEQDSHATAHVQIPRQKELCP